MKSVRQDAFVASGRWLWLVQTGLAANSAMTVANLIVDFDPELVCLLGFAGAVDPSLAVGDTLEGGVIWSADSGECIVPAPLGIAGRMAQMATVTRIAESPSEKAAIFQKLGCAVVEMEAFGVGKVCEAHGRVLVTARAISDAADETFPKELNGVIKPNGDLSMTRLLLAVVKKPTLVGPLLRLWKNNRKAKEGLRLIVRRLVKSLA